MTPRLRLNPRRETRQHKRNVRCSLMCYAAHRCVNVGPAKPSEGLWFAQDYARGIWYDCWLVTLICATFLFVEWGGISV